MRASKGKDGNAGGLGTPAVHPAPRVRNGVRRAARTTVMAAAQPESVLSLAKRVQFQDRLRTRLHDLLADEFAAYAKRGSTRKRLAARVGKTPEQVGKLLSGPEAPVPDAVYELVGAPPADPPRKTAPQKVEPRKMRVAKEPGAAAEQRKRRKVVADPANALMPGTTIAISSTPVGTGIAAVATVAISPIAQVETV